MKKPPFDHIISANALLDIVPSLLSALQAEYKECVRNLVVSPKFQHDTKTLLGDLRSILDYLAHELVRFCSRPPDKVYFPIAGRRVPQASFESSLSKRWLPGIDRSRPDIFTYLVRLQHFYPGNDWLPAFQELSNTNKHVILSEMQVAGYDAVLIRLDGKPVMQIGDRGYGSIVLGGTLVFRAGSRRAAIRGPQTIDRNTKQLDHADAGLDVVSATWTEFKFEEFPTQPAILFLEIAEREVRRVSEKLRVFVGR